MTARQIIELLIATWVVSGKTVDDFPLSDGLLDAALQTAIDRGAFGERFRDLQFIATPVGVRCVQLREMVDSAFTSLFLTAPNPTYASARVMLSREAAISILDEYSVSLSDAIGWGIELRRATVELDGR